MIITFRAIVSILALCMLSSCQYLTNSTPTCSDDATLSLVRQILGEMVLDGSAMPTNEVLSNRLTFDYPRATKLEENIRKYSCEAKLIVIGENSQKYEIELSYSSQVDDTDSHLVEVSGISFIDVAIIKSALLLPQQQTPEPSEQPQETEEEDTPAEVAELPAPTPMQIEQNRTARQAVLDGNGPSGQWPRFSDYSIEEIYSGPTATLDMSGETARTYRTRLREGLADYEIDTSGEYTSVGWGCGMGCFYITFVNKRTGQVVEAGIGGEMAPNERIAGIDSHSRLIITEGSRYDSNYNEIGYYAFFYELVDNKLNLISQTPIPRELEE